MEPPTKPRRLAKALVCWCLVFAAACAMETSSPSSDTPTPQRDGDSCLLQRGSFVARGAASSQAEAEEENQEIDSRQKQATAQGAGQTNAPRDPWPTRQATLAPASAPATSQAPGPEIGTDFPTFVSAWTWPLFARAPKLQLHARAPASWAMALFGAGKHAASVAFAAIEEASRRLLSSPSPGQDGPQVEAQTPTSQRSGQIRAPVGTQKSRLESSGPSSDSGPAGGEVNEEGQRKTSSEATADHGGGSVSASLAGSLRTLSSKLLALPLSLSSSASSASSVSSSRRLLVTSLFVALFLAMLLVILSQRLLGLLIKRRLERSFAIALKRPVKIGAARLRLVSSEVILEQIQVSNLEGFAHPHLLTIGRAALRVDLRKSMSTWFSCVEAHSLVLAQPVVHLEVQLNSSFSFSSSSFSLPSPSAYLSASSASAPASALATNVALAFSSLRGREAEAVCGRCLAKAKVGGYRPGLGTNRPDDGDAPTDGVMGAWTLGAQSVSLIAASVEEHVVGLGRSRHWALADWHDSDWAPATLEDTTIRLVRRLLQNVLEVHGQEGKKVAIDRVSPRRQQTELLRSRLPHLGLRLLGGLGACFPLGSLSVSRHLGRNPARHL